MVPDAPNFVETVTSASKYIRVAVNAANTNVQPGTSRGAAAPQPLGGTGRTRFRININGDGYQEVDLQDAVGDGRGAGSGLELGGEYRRCHHVCRQSIDEAAGINEPSCVYQFHLPGRRWRVALDLRFR